MKKRGFTLAEVLITLGIIGVIAALTLPNLIADYKKQTYVTQLRKTVSTLEQGFQKMRADAGGVDRFEDTEPYIKMRKNSEVGECMGNDYTSDEGCAQFYQDLKQYFNFTELITTQNYIVKMRNLGANESDNITDDFMVFADGAMVYWDSTEGITTTAFTIDINGYKAPNTYGYDVFYFNVEPSGKLIDSGSEDECKDGRMTGGCYNYLARNGWKMDY